MDVLIFTCFLVACTVNIWGCRDDLSALAGKATELLLATVARSTSTAMCEEEQFIACELDKFRNTSFRCFSRFLLRCGPLMALLLLREPLTDTTLAAFCVIGFFMILVALRWELARTGILGMYALTSVCSCTMTFNDKEAPYMVSKRRLCFLAQLLVGCLCCNKTISIPFSLAYSVAMALSFVTAYGWDNIDAWFVQTQLLELCVCAGFPVGLEMLLRMHAAATYHAQEAQSLTMGFRHIMKGLCDGEIVLDSDLKIYKGAACLQQLLSSEEDYTGCSFLDLLCHDGSEHTFSHFKDGLLQEVAATSEHEKREAPTCTRVRLKSPTPTGVRSVDLFHSWLARPVGPPFHLLVILEDGEHMAHSPPSRSSFAASERSNSITAVAQDRHGMPKEVTLLLSAAAPMYNITEMNLRFAAFSEEPLPSSATPMPTLRDSVPPLFWPRLHQALESYADALRVREDPGIRELAAVPVLLPVVEEGLRHLYARSVSLTPVRSVWPEDEGRVYMHLHLSDFENLLTLSDLPRGDEAISGSCTSGATSTTPCEEAEKLLWQMRQSAHFFNSIVPELLPREPDRKSVV